MTIYAIYSDITKSHILALTEPSNISDYLVVEVILKEGTPIKIALETGLSAISNISNSGASQQMIVIKLTFQ